MEYLFTNKTLKMALGSFPAQVGKNHCYACWEEPLLCIDTPTRQTGSCSIMYSSIIDAYVFIGIHFMHRHILKNEKWHWYIYDVFIPLFAGLVAASTLAMLWSAENSVSGDITQLGLAASVTLTVSLIATPILRLQIQHYFRSLRKRWKITHVH
jgi:hypothetical protein